MSLNTQYERLPYFTAVWRYNGSTYNDNTWEARTSAGTAFEMMADTLDYVYFGGQSKFRALVSALSTSGNYGDLTWEYSSSATAWTRFFPSVDYLFEASGYHKFENLVDWTSREFSNTSPHTATVPDTDERYWIRVSSQTSVTTTATVNSIECVPWLVYTTPTRIQRMLQLRDDFSSTTLPTRDAVEEKIVEVQRMIDDVANQSWQWNDTIQELDDFSMTGSKLRNEDIRTIYVMEIWNGGSFDSMTEGRANDFFIDSETGMIFFTRYFMLPTRFVYIMPYWRWGFGEFKFPLRTTYTWGKNWWTDKRAQRVQNLASKMVALDTISNHDYTPMLKAGLDRVSLDRKIDMWEREVENELDGLRRIVIY